MNTQGILEIRHSPLLRDEFLIKLTKEHKSNIYIQSKKTAGNLATLDLIENECTQYFMLGSNRGIDSFNLSDDGRSKNRFEAYCVTGGIYSLKNFLLREFKLDCTYKLNFQSISEYEYNIASPQTYENDITNYQLIEEIIQKLKPLDRKILQLIMYGETNGQNLVPIIKNNKVSNNLFDTIAHTLGYSAKYIYSRLYILRGVFASLPIYQENYQ